MVTSFYPLEYIAEMVGSTSVDVRDLTPPGVEPHDLELSSDELDELLDADVVLYIGGGFQPAVEDAVQQRGDDQVTVDVLSELGSAVGPRGRGDLDGAGATDPHIWLDPKIMQGIVDVVVRALNEADPNRERAAGGLGYGHAAIPLQDSLARLDADYRDRLEDCRSRLFVTTHAAFGYLADRYGLTQESIAGLSPEGETDPARLAEIEDLIRREHVTTVFTEPLVSSAVADTIARETGTDVAVLNPIESITDAEREQDVGYVTIMRKNLEALRGALECTG